MRLPVLEENYVTFKLINQDNKSQLSYNNGFIDKPISILDLMGIIYDSLGVVCQSGETVTSFGVVSPRILFNDDTLFIFINRHGYKRFVSAPSYDHAMDMYSRFVNINDIMVVAEVVPIDVVKGE